jgi:hypothetical protein
MLTSSWDINITGSNVSSTNGDLNLTAMLGNLNIKAGETTYSNSSKFSSRSLGGSVGNNGAQANIGMGEGESSLDQTTFTNSQLVANNGTLKINTGTGLTSSQMLDGTKGNTLISGANLSAKDIDLTVGGNLLVKSKQNLLESDSYNFGLNVGISSRKSGSVSGGSGGFNMKDSFQSRAWSDQLTSIIGTNSVTINTTKNTDIVGAVIANKGTDGSDLENLTLNTGSLTYSDLKNYNNSESNQFGMNLSFGFKSDDPTAPQNSPATIEAAKKQEGVLPGALALNLAMHGNESSSDTKATIGKGTINIGGQVADDGAGSGGSSGLVAGLNRDIAGVEANKRDVLTSDFDASIKIDLRLIAASYYGLTGDSAKASNNWGSYSGDTVKGAKITGYAIAIPTTGIYKYATNSDLTLQDTLYATGKNYNHLYNLAYNPNIDAKYFTGDANLASYDGSSLEDGADAKGAAGFYDRRNGVVAVNADSNQKDNQLAGTLAHEGVHREMNLDGRSYSSSEEAAAHMVGDFVGGAWDSFQADNTVLRGSIPAYNPNSPSSIANNFYAGGVRFGDRVNPDVALHVKPDGAGGNGHAGAYIQDKDGNWYFYDKNIAKDTKTSVPGLILGFSYPAQIDLLNLDTPNTPEVKNNLINNPDIIYIRTTPEQDEKIFQKANELNSVPDRYTLCTKNCLDSVQDIFKAGNVKYPIDFNPKPNTYFKKLKTYYPDNKTNQSYDK